MTRLNYCCVTAKFYVCGCFSQSNFYSQIYISLFSNTNLTFTLSVLWHFCLQSLIVLDDSFINQSEEIKQFKNIILCFLTVLRQKIELN